MTPHFNNFNEFIAMGEHGIYVWTCYGLSIFLLIFAILFARYERKKILKTINTQKARQSNRKKIAKTTPPT